MAVAVISSGCLGGDEETRPAGGSPREIAEVVQRLEEAVAERDFATVCEDVLTADARERAGGDDCEAEIRSAAEDVARPSLEMRAIEVKAESARVDVTTRASGQPELPEVLELRHEDGEWRVEALVD
jgi:hypothetical protein